MLDSTGGVRLVRACTAMEPNATFSRAYCSMRGPFPFSPTVPQYSEQKAKVKSLVSRGSDSV
jgi:hypothetical protein